MSLDGLYGLQCPFDLSTSFPTVILRSQASRGVERELLLQRINVYCGPSASTVTGVPSASSPLDRRPRSSPPASIAASRSRSIATRSHRKSWTRSLKYSPRNAAGVLRMISNSPGSPHRRWNASLRVSANANIFKPNPKYGIVEPATSVHGRRQSSPVRGCHAPSLVCLVVLWLWFVLFFFF